MTRKEGGVEGSEDISIILADQKEGKTKGSPPLLPSCLPPHARAEKAHVPCGPQCPHISARDLLSTCT